MRHNPEAAPTRITTVFRPAGIGIEIFRAASRTTGRMSDEPALSPGCEILLLEDDVALRKRLAAYLLPFGAAATEDGPFEEGRSSLRGVQFRF